MFKVLPGVSVFWKQETSCSEARLPRGNDLNLSSSGRWSLTTAGNTLMLEEMQKAGKAGSQAHTEHVGHFEFAH